MMTRTGGLLTVVTTRAGAAPGVAPSRRTRRLLVRVTPDRPFPQAWNEAVLQWQRSARQRHPASPSPR
jgi:hypothetical protein